MAVMFAKLHNIRGTRKLHCFKARFGLTMVRFYFYLVLCSYHFKNYCSSLSIFSPSLSLSLSLSRIRSLYGSHSKQNPRLTLRAWR